MSIPQNHIDKLLSDCGRRCCICRLFKPLHLQVHHIQPREDGGSDEPENLIALCVNCHSSIHTKTCMTRHFTAAELQQHRENTIAFVREGRFVENSEPPTNADAIVAAIFSALAKPAAPKVDILPEAIEILIMAANSGGTILPYQYDNGWVLVCGQKEFGGDETDPRTQATYRKAFNELVESGLVEHAQRNVFGVSHDGYLLADQLIAAERLRMAHPDGNPA